MENTGILKEWFDRVDSANSGSITAPQLQNALAVGNLNFPHSIVQQMIRMYDFDRNGTMSFEEFVALNKFLLKVCILDNLSIVGRGYLVPDDVYEALVKIGFTLDSPAFYTVCECVETMVKEKSIVSEGITASANQIPVMKSIVEGGSTSTKRIENKERKKEIEIEVEENVTGGRTLMKRTENGERTEKIKIEEKVVIDRRRNTIHSRTG
ncbi:sorcin-like [Cucumis melo var. makuwa]|uniref:Sorcin-like n=1 Tax=Cucumis melo var. makuwa TaxID=1194695 RepID=A0A5A7TW95_CUCMM|nr:sorcin-like [Cucumis melo var. makuwa]